MSQAKSFIYAFLNLSIFAIFIYGLFQYPLYYMYVVIGILAITTFAITRVLRALDKEANIIILASVDLEHNVTNFDVALRIFKYDILSAFFLYQILKHHSLEVQHKEKTRKYRAKQESKYISPKTQALKNLGLEDETNKAEIKKAYRQMVKLYHPDTTVLSPEIAQTRFIILTDSKETLLKIYKE